ncbi:glycosyltransferase family 39 protein [Streptomyces griseoaurantiacus]|uniref:glycosyltransferase family 39 protein n=1 Tax=Streptomyces griseoaurantiacus TaxID=68213 RepID=UPI002ED18C27|nr:glycosyltransferase family 39 protein [Streptomyces jietaisiensis]
MRPEAAQEETITTHPDLARPRALLLARPPVQAPAPAPARAPRRGTALVPLLAPALLATALGLWGLDRRHSMWRDEAVTYEVAHRPLGALGELLGRIDAVHGLYYLLLHAVFALWDGGLTALRLPSVAGAALAAAGVGATGARLAGGRAGTLAGAVFALLPAVQQYAQEGRSYALVCAAVIWSGHFLLRALDRPAAARRWCAYGAVLALACWLHEFAVLVLLAHAVTLRWLRVPRWVALRWGLTAGTVVLAVSPLVLLSLGQSAEQLGWLGRPGPEVWLGFWLVGGAGALLVRWTRGPGYPPSVLGAWALPPLLVPGGVLLLVSLVRPYYVDRYVLHGLAGLALPAGAALDRALARARRGTGPVGWAAARWLGGAAVVLAVLVPWSLHVRAPESRKDDVVAVARAVERTARPGDAVLFLPGRRREWLLWAPSVHRRLDDLALDQGPRASHTLQGTELPAGTVRRRLDAVDRVLALGDPPGEPLDPYPVEAVKREVLGARFRVCARTEVWGARITVYARPGHCGRGAGTGAAGAGDVGDAGEGTRDARGHGEGGGPGDHGAAAFGLW